MPVQMKFTLEMTETGPGIVREGSTPEFSASGLLYLGSLCHRIIESYLLRYIMRSLDPGVSLAKLAEPRRVTVCADGRALPTRKGNNLGTHLEKKVEGIHERELWCG